MENSRTDSKPKADSVPWLVRFLAVAFIASLLLAAAIAAIALPVMIVLLVIADPIGCLWAAGMVAAIIIGLVLLASLWCAAWDVLVPRNKSNV